MCLAKLVWSNKHAQWGGTSHSKEKMRFERMNCCVFSNFRSPSKSLRYSQVTFLQWWVLSCSSALSRGRPNCRDQDGCPRPQLQFSEWPLESSHDTFEVHVHVEEHWHRHILSDWCNYHDRHLYRGNCSGGHEVHVEIKFKCNVLSFFISGQ